MKIRIKRMFAMLAAIGLILIIGLPAFAGGGLGDLYYTLNPGYVYDMTELRFDIPYTQYASNHTGSLYGSDVTNDTVTLVQDGTKYNFTWAQTLTTDEHYPFGASMRLQAGYYNIGGDLHQQFPIDGRSLFGFQKEPRTVNIRYDYTDVILSDTREDLKLYDEYDAYGPTIDLEGKISITITTTIDGTYTISDFQPKVNDDYEIVNENELTTMLSEYQTKISAGSTDGVTWFDEPQPITFRIDLDGRLVGFGGYPEMMSLIIGSSVMGEHDYTVNFQNMEYFTAIRDNKINDGDVDFSTFSIDCPLYVQALSWSMVPYQTIESDNNAGGYPPTVNENVSNNSDLTRQPEKVILVAAGTGIAALGASVIVSLIGDSAASVAASAVSGAVTSGVSGIATPGSSSSGSSSFSTTISGDSTDGAESLPQDQEENDSETSEDEEALAENSDEDSSEVPELPEEDSPNVSMSLFAPDKDLLNVKGGVASITVEIKGGEGYLWNYMPTVICPGTLKAIVPTVTGRSHLATLNLGMTGTKLASRHYEVFVTVVAWAYGADGKPIKTHKSMEFKLHEPGIEAKKNADESLTVSACVPTTLKGFADVRVLSEEEYTCTTLPDGTIEIKALDERLGTALIKP